LMAALKASLAATAETQEGGEAKQALPKPASLAARKPAKPSARRPAAQAEPVAHAERTAAVKKRGFKR
ncbi:MAG TPA: poly(3-hydroxyalkanoate) granule-associated protein PhaF, partial [Thermoanaerobaculia bacterium]